MNQQHSHPVIALAGPTGSGKTDWSLKLAMQFPSSILSADSRTVYRQLDIGTNKPTVDYPSVRIETMQGPVFQIQEVDHYGLDLVGPDITFTASDFQAYAFARIAEIQKQGRLALLVGGTGLYIDAVLDGYCFPKSVELPKEFTGSATRDLAARLSELDPSTAAVIDQANRLRVERALAFVLATGKSWMVAAQQRQVRFSGKRFVINRTRTELYDRIDRKVLLWIEQGLLKEVKALSDLGISDERINAFGLVYRYGLLCVRGELAEREFVRLLQYQLHAYARRQLTWWRRRQDVQWISSYTQLETQVALLMKEIECSQPSLRSPSQALKLSR